MSFQVLLACGAGIAAIPIGLWLVATPKRSTGLSRLCEILAALFFAAIVFLGVVMYFRIGWPEHVGARVAAFLLFAYGAVYALSGLTGSRQTVRIFGRRRRHTVLIRRDESPWIFFTIVSFELIGSLCFIGFLCADALGVLG